MRIPINKDFEKAYKDQLFRGFSSREVVYIVISLAIIASVAFLVAYFFNLDLTICIYIGIPFGIPTLLVGFKEIQGLTVGAYLKEIFHERKIKELYYDADEIPESTKVYKMKKEVKRKRRSWRRK